MHQDEMKKAVAKAALQYVEEGIVVGVGTGSTANHFIDFLAADMKGLIEGAVASSEATRDRLKDHGIPVYDLNAVDEIPVYIDGADEVDANLNLIKGGGGALLQEKIVATASDRMVVIADVGKEVETLGAFPLPVEVIPFGWQTTQALVEETLVSMDVLGRESTLRMNGEVPYVTDEGNHIIDLHLKRIGNARQLALVLNQMPGVVENGLFIDICDTVVLGFGDGKVEVRDINDGTVDTERLDILETGNLFNDLSD